MTPAPTKKLSGCSADCGRPSRPRCRASTSTGWPPKPPGPTGGQVFNRLADEEVLHQQFLRAQVKALEETGKPAAGLALGQPEKFPGDHPISRPSCAPGSERPTTR